MLQEYSTLMADFQKTLPEGTMLTPQEINKIHKKITRVLLSRDVPGEEIKAKNFLKEFKGKLGAK